MYNTLCKSHGFLKSCVESGNIFQKCDFLENFILSFFFEQDQIFSKFTEKHSWGSPCHAPLDPLLCTTKIVSRIVLELFCLLSKNIRNVFLRFLERLKFKFFLQLKPQLAPIQETFTLTISFWLFPFYRHAQLFRGHLNYFKACVHYFYQIFIFPQIIALQKL